MEKAKHGFVTNICLVFLQFHVVSDWLLHNGKCQNQIKVFTVLDLHSKTRSHQWFQSVLLKKSQYM